MSNPALVCFSANTHRFVVTLRNIFWICYTLDKDVPLGTGQPPASTDENCDLSLPPGYAEQAFCDPDKADDLTIEPVFPFDLRLSLIKSRAHRSLYSINALTKSDAEVLKSVRELDDDLSQWRLSIPPEWRPTMLFCSEMSDPNMSMRTLAFYPMSALLTIFCSILRTPLDTSSRADLDRSKIASIMIDRVFSRKLSENDMVHLKPVASSNGWQNAPSTRPPNKATIISSAHQIT
ncbi:hypothetical protein ABOM_004304 [Aspergillus bombycis]|uniref:Xylanolytic transcriptional activator regulatory domain-containing protein n=1 Tax=Aspergillus bombycis TaxID=109264 RepID=A0A1F8A8L4_9EURO|nr:hypothetical protein ABOM_004304 [Aspergillus bombycis]OGM47705.1 hypothetical protein ABOM_004304 [Aspergillus bombycis]